MTAAEILPMLQDIYRQDPAYGYLQPWELQHVLYSLGYTDDLAEEAEIAAAVEGARTDWPQWRAA